MSPVKTLALQLLISVTALAAPSLQTWPVDALTKVFPQDAPGSNQAAAPPLLARNGHATIQLAIRATERLKKLNVTLAADPALTWQVRHVGYVPVDSNPPGTPADQLLRLAPAFFPDPLLEAFPYLLHPNRTEAIWVTVYAKPGTAPGLYKGTLAFTNEGKPLTTAPIAVQVTPATVPATQTLKVTNWIHLSAPGLARFYNLPNGEDEQYWQLLAHFAQVLADHKQNVILTPVKALTTTTIQNGELRYDFSRLDRWVDTFDRAGIHILEGGHLLGRVSGYNTPMCVPALVIEDGKIVSRALPPEDPRGEQYLNSFLPALYAHIKEKGWQNRYLQHIHDEPHDKEAAVYNRYAGIIRRNLPGIPTLDAIALDQDLTFLKGMVDVWVPILGSFDTRIEKIRTHQAEGGESWFYTCIYPQGRQLNRFTDLPLLQTRLLHWYNYRHSLTGYLHWGGNHWTDSPFTDVQPIINDGTTLLPAGDNAIFYPDPAKRTLLGSIRLEAMREGIEDYELLTALAKKDPARARRLAETAIPHFTDYIRDVAAFRRLQAELYGN